MGAQSKPLAKSWFSSKAKPRAVQMKRKPSLKLERAPSKRMLLKFFMRLEALLGEHRAVLKRLGFRYQLELVGAGSWVIDFSNATLQRGESGAFHAKIRADAELFMAMRSGATLPRSHLDLTGDPACLSALLRLISLSDGGRPKPS